MCSIVHTVSFNSEQMNELLDENKDDILNCGIDTHTSSYDGVNNIRQEKESSSHFHYVTVDQVIYAVDKLKVGKADSCDDLLSDKFKNTTNMLYVYISFLFSMMLVTGLPLLVFSYLQ